MEEKCQLKVVVVTVDGTMCDVSAAVKRGVKEALRERDEERAAERLVQGIKLRFRTTDGS